MRPSALSAPGHAWAALAVLLGLVAAAGFVWLPPDALVWRRATPLAPSRWLTPVMVHFTPLHLLANLAALAVLAMLGRAARLPGAAALAWALAWPATHALLPLAQGLDRYAGLSGVVHAGTAVAALFMMACAQPRLRMIGALVATGLAAKLWSEDIWQRPVQFDAAWGFPVAVAAHASGALAGAGAGLLMLGLQRLRRA
ncbi:hypothetical protein OOT46_02120 [Aquabacterium sp. A7-Y]|uniref:hypothetical protein n=1 Tax=Aquabacterium sp. A7-Y TaxID=1349605 RepID=UPI00223E66B8|nr:hypothetical protein [Aquabacterium sp. A7-Y]MCW7536653.1 hypothetical protein [Aquabacterium sp. A7-Y]